jgi:3-deoxy-7-phosphoheptulonate synthase
MHLMPATRDVNVQGFAPLPPPAEIVRRLPLSDVVARHVLGARAAIGRVLDGEDRRLLVIVGPCSIHDVAAALEYAGRLRQLVETVRDELLIVMRVYFEKPRTTVGWKGLIYDPHLDGSNDLATGLFRARELLLHVNELGLSAATEFLEPFVPQYIADLVAWAAIGARTTESQTHRQLASGLSMPVGFKNGTGGSTQMAVDAVLAARTPHSFLGIDYDGRACVVTTRGNPAGHVVLRGGSHGANYHAADVARVCAQLERAGLPERVIVDCSHANSGKDHRRQPVILRDVLAQRTAGDGRLVGCMLESHLFEGNQPHTGDSEALRYGVSITDACLGWEETADLLREAAGALRASWTRPVAAPF